MSPSRSSWLNLARSVGQALLELIGAELGALRGDLKLSGRRLTGALLLFVLALFTLFWALGALAVAAVEYLALSFERWQASLIVLAVLFVATLVLGALGWWRLRSIEPPAATVRRRMDDHMAWWNGRILEEEGVEPTEEDEG